MGFLSVFERNTGAISWQIFLILIVIIGIMAIIDIATSKFQNNQKLVWFLICFFVPFGGLIYFFIGRKQKVKPV